ncbi:DUF2760 domain-containing protein [Marinagarivorans algicola]|uniref:DUF2760 domain-containing protein n=1 Tax=Marinagarivorans algicola TaxID=1513270 RepID=UPI003734F058
MNLETGPLTIDLLHLVLIAAVIFLVITVIRINAVTKAMIKTGTSTPVEPSANPEPQPQSEPEPEPEPEPETPIEQPASAPTVEALNTDSALQLLGLLQKESRFIDFTQEDLTDLSDAEIGAVARLIQAGSQKALAHYFTLVPIASELEESPIEIPVGFDPAHYRLNGNVVGEAPFNGTLIHRGWRVTRCELPKIAQGHDTTILAPAEVEL